MKLYPLIVQDAASGKVFSLLYANAQAIRKMRQTGFVWRWSRSKKRLLMKGTESRNSQKIAELLKDCDGDALLARVRANGPACGEGFETCFHKTIGGKTIDKKKFDARKVYSRARILEEVLEVIKERKKNPRKNSFTSRIVCDQAKILGKLGEESVELAKARSRKEKVWEAADVLYFTLVLFANKGVNLKDAFAELERRRRR